MARSDSHCRGFRLIRALRAADGAVVIVTGGTPVVGVIGLYCSLTRRRLIFASASDLDFVDGPAHWLGRRRLLYRAGVRMAAAVVVLSRGSASSHGRASLGFRSVLSSTSRPSSRSASPRQSARSRSSSSGSHGCTRSSRPELYAQLAEAVPDARFATSP